MRKTSILVPTFLLLAAAALPALAQEAAPEAKPRGGETAARQEKPAAPQKGAAGREVWRGFPALELDAPRHVWRGKPITLSLRDADLVEVLRSFAKLTDANLVIDPRVSGKVTVELKDVPWDQALYVILKTQGLGVEITGNVYALKAQRDLLRNVD